MKIIRFLNNHIFALCLWGLTFFANQEIDLIERQSSDIFGLSTEGQPQSQSTSETNTAQKAVETPAQALARLGVPMQAQSTQVAPENSEKSVVVDFSVNNPTKTLAQSSPARVPRLRRKSTQLVNARLNRDREVPRRSSTMEKKRNMSELEQIKLENTRLEREIQLMLAGEFGPESAIEDHELFKFVFPNFARPIDKDGYSIGRAGFCNADWAYADNKRTVSLGELVYGKAPTIQDFSLIARLARKSSAQNGTTWGAQPDGINTTGFGVKKYLVGDTSLGANSVGLEDALFQSSTNSASTSSSITKLNTSISDAINVKIWDHYLNRIADQQLEFKSNTKQINFNASFAKNFFSNLYNIVFTVPVVFRSNKVEMLTDFPASKITELNGADVVAVSNFFAKYPAGLQDFFKSFLKAQNIDQDSRSSQFGVGDISLHINRKMNIRELDLRGVVGLGVTAPTSVKVNNKQLWPAILGNGGFWELSAHIAGYTSLSSFANPHFFAQVCFPIPAKVEMRTAKIVTRQGSPFFTTDNERANNFAFGNEFVFSNQFNWSEKESTIPLLAREPLQTIDVNKGISVTMEVGTLLKDVVSKDFSIDLSYKFVYKAADSAGFRSRDANYDTPSLFANTTQEMHRIAGTLCYRYKKDLQFEATLGQVVLGRNVPRAMDVGFVGHMSF